MKSRLHRLTGQHAVGVNGGMGSMACPADLDGDRAGLEIAVGTSLYTSPSDLPTCATPSCTGALDTVWHAPDIASQESETRVDATPPAGGSLEVTGQLPSFPARGDITVYGVVDPSYAVGDCARGNNKGPASAPTAAASCCSSIPLAGGPAARRRPPGRHQAGRRPPGSRAGVCLAAVAASRV